MEVRKALARNAWHNEEDTEIWIIKKNERLLFHIHSGVSSTVLSRDMDIDEGSYK